MKINDLTKSAIMLSVLILCSQLSIPLAFIPMTLQTLAVLMIGYLLEPKHAVFTTILYLMIGLIGLPVFSNFSGGIQSIFLPSFGFIIGFIPATYLQSFFLSKQLKPTIKHLSIAALIHYVVLYSMGLLYMSWVLNVYLGNQFSLSGILAIGFLPFIPADLIKITVAIVLSKRIMAIQKR